MTPSQSPTTPASSTGLVLLCKRPALGHSKQRLAAEIGQQAAWHIAERLLQCALEDLAAWPGAQVIAPDAEQHLAWAGQLCPQAQAIAQADGNLGQRINRLDQHLRGMGHTRLIFIGSDCPQLHGQHLLKAAQLLHSHDTVLFPASDGGVVLMASRRPWPDLSERPWSTAQLGAALAAACRQAGHAVIEADLLEDIDHWQDLQRAQAHLAGDTRPARAALLASLDTIDHAQR